MNVRATKTLAPTIASHLLLKRTCTQHSLLTYIRIWVLQTKKALQTTPTTFVRTGGQLRHPNSQQEECGHASHKPRTKKCLNFLKGIGRKLTPSKRTGRVGRNIAKFCQSLAPLIFLLLLLLLVLLLFSVSLHSSFIITLFDHPSQSGLQATN